MSREYNYGGTSLIVDSIDEIFESGAVSTKTVNNIKQIIGQQKQSKDINKLKEQIGGAAEDGTISASEKPGLSREWASLVSSYSSIADKFQNYNLTDNTLFYLLQRKYEELSPIMGEILANMDTSYTDKEKVSKITDLFVECWEDITKCLKYIEDKMFISDRFALQVSANREIVTSLELKATLLFYDKGSYTDVTYTEAYPDEDFIWRKSSDSSFERTGKILYLTLADMSSEEETFSITFRHVGHYEDPNHTELVIERSINFSVYTGTLSQWAWSDAESKEELLADAFKVWTASRTESNGKKYLWRRDTEDLLKLDSEKEWIYVRESGLDGLNGTIGKDGYSRAQLTLYKRSASGEPTKDDLGTITYTFATNAYAGELGGWSKTIPTGTGDIYAIYASALFDGETDTISPNEWTTPAKLSTEGAKGEDGMSIYTIILFKRSASVPSTPSGNVSYNFHNNALSGADGWHREIPTSDGNPLYAITATAASRDESDIIYPSEWSAPSIYVVDGKDGKDGEKGDKGEKGETGEQGPKGDTGEAGKGIASITKYYATTQTQTQPSASEITSTTLPTLSATDKYLWCKEVIKYTGGSDSKSASGSVINIYNEDGVISSLEYPSNGKIHVTGKNLIYSIDVAYFVFDGDEFTGIGDNKYRTYTAYCGAGTYTFSASKQVYLLRQRTNSVMKELFKQNITSYTFELTEPAKVEFCLRYLDSTGIVDSELKCQIEQGTSATEYAEYISVADTTPPITLLKPQTTLISSDGVEMKVTYGKPAEDVNISLIGVYGDPAEYLEVDCKPQFYTLNGRGVNDKEQAIDVTIDRTFIPIENTCYIKVSTYKDDAIVDNGEWIEHNASSTYRIQIPMHITYDKIIVEVSCGNWDKAISIDAIKSKYTNGEKQLGVVYLHNNKLYKDAEHTQEITHLNDNLAKPFIDGDYALVNCDGDTIPYRYTAGVWTAITSDITTAQDYSNIMLDTLVDVLASGKDVQKSMKAHYAFIGQLAAQTATIEKIFSKHIRVLNEGSIYAGGFDEKGNNANNNAGFHLSADGNLQAVGATLKSVTVNGSVDCSDDNGDVLKTSYGKQGTSYACSPKERWSHADMCSSLSPGSVGTGSYDGANYGYQRTDSNNPHYIVNSRFGVGVTLSFTALIPMTVYYELPSYKQGFGYVATALHLNGSRIVYANDGVALTGSLSLNANDVVMVENIKGSSGGSDFIKVMLKDDAVVLYGDDNVPSKIIKNEAKFDSSSASIGAFSSSSNIKYATADGWFAIKSGGVSNSSVTINGASYTVNAASNNGSTLILSTTNGSSFTFVKAQKNAIDSIGWYNIAGTLTEMAEERGVTVESLYPVKDGITPIGTDKKRFSGYFSGMNVSNAITAGGDITGNKVWGAVFN